MQFSRIAKTKRKASEMSLIPKQIKMKPKENSIRVQYKTSDGGVISMNAKKKEKKVSKND